jgi:AraC-like DNA-binding protein
MRDVVTLADRVRARMEGHPGPLLRPVPRVALFRQTAPTPIRADFYEPVVCLVLDGRKEATFGELTLDMGPGDALLVSHGMPVQSRITCASPDAPYLCVVLRLDLDVLRSLVEQVRDTLADARDARAAVVHGADQRLIQAMARYVELPDDPVERRVMGPLLLREIHFRLLLAPHGGMLRRLLRHDSHASNVSRAIAHIRRDFRSALAVPDLARRVGMSPSSFHKHFRDITSSTPLQYQKELRLQEARRLLSAGDHAVTTVAYDVGYASPNQFSREYTRKFGVPPSAHVGAMA